MRSGATGGTRWPDIPVTGSPSRRRAIAGSDRQIPETKIDKVSSVKEHGHHQDEVEKGTHRLDQEAGEDQRRDADRSSRSASSVDAWGILPEIHSAHATRSRHRDRHVVADAEVARAADSSEVEDVRTSQPRQCSLAQSARCLGCKNSGQGVRA